MEDGELYIRPRIKPATFMIAPPVVAMFLGSAIAELHSKAKMQRMLPYSKLLTTIAEHTPRITRYVH